MTPVKPTKAVGKNRTPQALRAPNPDKVCREPLKSQKSGTEKAHKHNFFDRPVTVRWGEESSRSGVQVSKICVLSSGIQGTYIFLSGYPTGKTGDRGDRTECHVPEFYVPSLGSEKNTQRKKHINTIFTGLSGDFGGTLFMCFFSPTRNEPKKTHKQHFGTHPVPGTIPQICLCLCAFFFP